MSPADTLPSAASTRRYRHRRASQGCRPDPVVEGLQGHPVGRRRREGDEKPSQGGDQDAGDQRERRMQRRKAEQRNMDELEIERDQEGNGHSGDLAPGIYRHQYQRSRKMSPVPAPICKDLERLHGVMERERDEAGSSVSATVTARPTAT